MIFNIIIAALGTALLVWAAIVDSRTRKIPVAAGFGMLGLGLAVLVKGAKIVRLKESDGEVFKIWRVRGIAIGVFDLLPKER